MITVNVSGVSQPYWFRAAAHPLVRMDTGNPAYIDRSGNILLSKYLADEPVSYTMGESHIVTGTKKWGQMRDRDCSHVQTSGTIDLATGASILGFHGTTYKGFPYVYAIPGTVHLFPCMATAHWNESSGWQCTFEEWTTPNYPAYGSKTYEECRVKYTMQRSGDNMFVIGEVYNGTVWKYEPTKKLSAAALKTGGIRRYQLRGGEVYSFSTLSKSGDYYTAGEIAAQFAAMPSTGGTLCTHEEYDVNSSGSTQTWLDEIQNFLNSRPYAQLAVDEHVDFGELALECSAQMKFVDQNILLMILDIRDFATYHTMWKKVQSLEIFVKYKALAKALGSKAALSAVRRIFKDWSLLYLVQKYGISLTVSDFKRLIAGLARSTCFLGMRRVHSRRVTSIANPSATYHTLTSILTCEVAEYPTWLTGQVQRLIGFMKKAGSYPSFQNIWDVLKYSFVVDWFVQFGDFLNDLDNFMDMKDYFPVHYVIQSEKYELGIAITSAVPEFPGSGVVEFSYYHRWISREVPLPSAYLTMETQLGKHLVESAALIFQRKL